MFDEKVQSLSYETNANLNQIIDFQNELVDLNKKAANTPVMMHKEVLNECNDKEEQINKHINHQKTENMRINGDLNDLKNCNDDFSASLVACQKKLKELEMKIGIDVPVK
jgi:chromosome segregation ATPase